MFVCDFVLRSLLKVVMLGQHAIDHAAAPGELHRQVSSLGSSLIAMGAVNATVMISALTEPADSIIAWPHSYFRVMFSAVVGISFISGLAGIIVGSFLLGNNNPGHYRILAMLILCTCCVAAPCAVGLLAVAYFSSYLMTCACYATYGDEGKEL